LSDTPKKVALLLGTVLLALAAGEIVLRGMDYGTIRPELNFGVNTKLDLEKGRFLPDDELFWKMPPHALDAEYRSVQPDTPLPARRGARRVLVLGDSCSKLSQQIPPYSVLLEDTLNTADVEVWNASVPGYTSWQGRAWLSRQLLDLEPQIAIVYFGWNDHWRSTGVTDADYAARRQGASLRLLSLLRRKPSEHPLRVSVAEYRANLEAIVSALSARGATVFLLAAPSHLTPEARRRLLQTGYVVAGDNAVELHRQYLMALKDVADSTAAVMLNISGLFADLNLPGQLIMRDGIHLTDRGHQVLAAVLAEACAPVLAGSPQRTVDPEALVRRARAAVSRITAPEGR
jgi:lysophospholipase L1-like esterase